jgi:hypothetical protein
MIGLLAARAPRLDRALLSAYELKWSWQDFRDGGVCHHAPVTFRHGWRHCQQV